MLRFLFRKTVFDSWDHILIIFLANIGYLILLAVECLWWYLNAIEKLDFSIALLLMVITVIPISIYTMGVTVFANNINERAMKGDTLKGLKKALLGHIGHILFHSFITLIVFINVLFALPFYMKMGGFIGPLFAFIGLFLTLFIIFNFKYYLPLCLIRPDDNVLEIVKYSFAYALDNKGFTTLLMLRSLLDLLISVPLIGILPGFTGILISDTCATMMLNKRYVLAEERKAEKREVSWQDVLEAMELKRYDKRKYRSLLFPGR